MDHLFTCRDIKAAAFDASLGSNRYLAVPAGAAHHTPQHQISASQWFKAVTADAVTGHHPVSGNPVGDVVIFVHGYNQSPLDVLRRHRRLRTGLEALGYKGAVVSFDWPSGSQAAAYLVDRERADRSAYRLMTAGITPLTKVNDPQTCDVSIHVLAHSMGSYVVREAFTKADDAMEPSSKNWSVAQMMLCAGDVSSDSMGPSANSRSLYLHSVRVTNYFNRHDSILSVSGAKRIGISPRVGRIGLPATAPAKAVDVDCSDYYDAHHADFAGIQNADHSFYFHDRTVLKDMLETIRGHRDRQALDTREMRNGVLTLVKQRAGGPSR